MALFEMKIEREDGRVSEWSFPSKATSEVVFRWLNKVDFLLAGLHDRWNSLVHPGRFEKLPINPHDSLVNYLSVKPELRDIESYRRNKLKK